MYKSIIFSLQPLTDELSEVLIALLDSNNFEGIYQEESTLTGYISEEFYNEGCLHEIKSVLKDLSCNMKWEEEDLPDKNWNEVWESNFDPVLINSRCVIRAPFHREFPECKYQITIEPKMSFGTGHHHTTHMILQRMLEQDFNDKIVLDMGCGTGVLAILAFLMGANRVTAIDYDKWAYENTIENVNRNIRANTKNSVTIIQGSSEAIPNEKYDVILANINRNILIEQMPEYAAHAKAGCMLYLSGLMIDDISLVRSKAESEDFSFISEQQSDQWALLLFKRN